MPGIAGMITELPRQFCEDKLKRMVGTMRHEDFYNHGFNSDSDMHTYVGWTCHANSFVDCMPISNERRDIFLFLAGEVFPDADLVNNLRNLHHEFTEGDASYLVHLYEELGDRFFEELNGCFSGVLVDSRLKKSFLFNDRYGMHRLFVHSGKQGVFFSSEAKALLAVLPETRAFDPKGLVELATCGCTLGDHSLFRDIEVLPGGTLLEFVQGRQLRKTKYFDRKTWETQPILSESEFFSRFTDLLPGVANKYTSAGPDISVAMSLTGGYDSRMLMACLNPSRDSLPCYTFGSMYRDTFDVKVARKVATACGQQHHELVLGETFLNDLPGYLEKAVYLSDGYLGLSGAAELYANTLSRQIAPVRLTGNWGSELLRGVRAFKFTEPKIGFLHPDLNEYIEEARETFDRISEMDNVSFAAFLQAPHQSYGRISIERSQIVPRAPFLDNELIQCIYQAPGSFNGFALAERIIGHYRPDLLEIPTDRGFLGGGGKLTRMARRAFRQALFKAEYLIGHGAPDWIVRQGRFPPSFWLERKLLGRHKFYHFRQWLCREIADFVRDTLSDYRSSEARAYFETGPLEQDVCDHLDGKRNCSKEVDMMLMITLTSGFLTATGEHEAI